MKKIGIITHYYNSENYGGNLQAYALCYYINNYTNLYAEQICYDQNRSKALINEKKSICKKIKNKKIKDILKKIFYFKKTKTDLARKESFSFFNINLVKNSEEVYYDEDIIRCNEKYDLFITGSDQVWNLKWYRKPFFLDFVLEGKIKISYAASISMDCLLEEQRIIFKNHLKDYKAVSVREKQAIGLLKDLSPVEPQLVVDPTLLLSRGDWDIICSERLVKEKYIFCYALGDNRYMRKVLKKYARKHKLKIVFIPFAGGNQYFYNNSFGDIRLTFVTPQDFISLIKYAECVFTDSFHGVVFSYIYQKVFFVFNRNKKGDMNSRIFNIVELFNCEERFIYEKEHLNVEYLESLKSIDYSNNEKLLELIKASKEYLRENLEVEDEEK